MTAGLRTTILIAQLAWLAPAIASAQGLHRVELSGGIAFDSPTNVLDTDATGWTGGGAWWFNDWLSLGVEASGSQQSAALGFIDLDASFRSWMAGATVAWPSTRIRPFGRVFLGVTQIQLQATAAMLDAGESKESHATLQAGGGVEISVINGLSARVAVDGRHVNAVTAYRQRRVSVALVYRLGSGQM